MRTYTISEYDNGWTLRTEWDCEGGTKDSTVMVYPFEDGNKMIGHLMGDFAMDVDEFIKYLTK